MTRSYLTREVLCCCLGERIEGGAQRVTGNSPLKKQLLLVEGSLDFLSLKQAWFYQQVSELSAILTN